MLRASPDLQRAQPDLQRALKLSVSQDTSKFNIKPANAQSDRIAAGQESAPRAESGWATKRTCPFLTIEADDTFAGNIPKFETLSILTENDG